MSRLTASLRVVRAALADRWSRRILAAFVLFSVAEWAGWVGLLVYGFAENGPAGAAWISAIQLVPAALVTPFTSSLADRFDRTRVLASGYLVAALGTGGAGIAIAAGSPFGVVAASAVIGVVGITMVRPTQASLLPQLTDTPEELTATNACAGLITAGSLFAGPGIASLGLAASGASAVVLGAGAFLLAGAFLVASVRRGTASPGTTGARVDVLGGFRLLRHHSGAAMIVALVGLQAAARVMIDVLIVTVAVDELGLGNSGVGVLTAALGVGALVGGAATMTLIGRDRLSPAIGLGVALWGVPLLGVGFAGAVTPVLVLLAAAGVGLAYFEVAGRSLLQRTVSDEALGRVFGLLESGFMGSWAVGAAAAPLLLGLLGIGWTFVVAGAALPLLAVAGWAALVAADRTATLPGPELAILRGIEMFRPLAGSVVERLARNLIEIAQPSGTAIIREGDPGDLFYVIAEGRVRVTVAGEEVAVYGPGEYFGEIALLRDVPRQASVTSLTDVRLFTLERSRFLDAMTGSSSAAAAAHREVDRRLGGSVGEP